MNETDSAPSAADPVGAAPADDEFEALLTHIRSGGSFAITDVDDDPNAIGVLCFAHGDLALPWTALRTAQGEPMPSRGFALLSFATMLVKRETQGRA